jgi:peptidyl-prolyl cis-trans isomerase SurA
MKNLLLIAFAGIIIHTSVFAADKKKGTDPVILIIGNKPVTVSEFLYVYNKNNANTGEAYSSKNLEEYLELYIKFRLKVREAEELGMDTTKAFLNELEGYKKQLAQPYLTEKSVTEKLVKQAYERLQQEIKAAHILVKVSPDADPKDTLDAYNRIMSIRKEILDGKDFETVAKKSSDDPSAQNNGGNLGYFTALQMVYPFEEGAYNTPVGQVSMPVRTKFGYHIIKVLDKRKAMGEVKVAHIMIRYSANTNPQDSIAAFTKAQEILKKLKAGEKWNLLCYEYSEDMNSKGKGGELPPFTTGNILPSFEEAAFSIKNVGEYTDVIQTPYGFHIIKLLERKELQRFEDMEASLRARVNKDSRSAISKDYLIARLKKENKFTENPKGIKAAFAKADSNLLKGKFTYDPTAKDLKDVIFSISNKKYTVGQFLSYVKEKQKARTNISPSTYISQMYKEYVNESLLDFEEKNLENKYNDYKMLVKEYRDGILLFSLMDAKVWTKAIEDTAGLKKFYEANKNNYMWEKRYVGTLITCKNKNSFELLKSNIDKTSFDVETEKIEPLKYPKGQYEVKADVLKKADEVINILNRDKNYSVEINFGAEAGELANPKLNTSLAKARSKAFVDYLISKGVDPARIKTTEKSNIPVAKNKDSKTATFKITSSSITALEKNINAKEPLTVQIKKGKFQVSDEEVLKEKDWKIGYNEHTIGDKYYIFNVTEILEPTPKALEEAKGTIISDYQNQLEAEWVESLKKKYKVEIITSELNKLKK